jgi:DNA-binding MarR family transcriptional regulator
MALRFLSPIHKAYRQISIFLEDRCSGLDLSATEGQLLSYLRSYNPAPVSELHRVLGVKRSTLTSILDRLEARKWLARQHSQRDRRVILVGLTDAGCVGADRVRQTVEQLEAEIGARVGPDDLRGFGAVLSAIDAATEVVLAPPKVGSEPTEEIKETA